MNVGELVEHLLQRFPQNLPVRVKTYGCGQDSWADVNPEMVNDMIDGSTGDRICEIQADWN